MNARAPHVAGLILLGLAPQSFAQTLSATAVETSAGDASTLWIFICYGGWMIFPIALCLLGVCFLITDGVARTSRVRIGPMGHEQSLHALFRQRDYAAADAFCKANPSSLTNILRAGIGLIGEGRQAAKEGVTAALASERLRLHTRFSHLRALALCTPLLGLLGSLCGLIAALYREKGNAATLPPAIAEALLPSAAGLFVGIVASAAFYVLRERASAAMLRLQDMVNSIFRKIPYDSLADARPLEGEED
jgi:biopolymer transport protein ExbB/TolQ